MSLIWRRPNIILILFIWILCIYWVYNINVTHFLFLWNIFLLVVKIGKNDCYININTVVLCYIIIFLKIVIQCCCILPYFNKHFWIVYQSQIKLYQRHVLGNPCGSSKTLWERPGLSVVEKQKSTGRPQCLKYDLTKFKPLKV